MPVRVCEVSFTDAFGVTHRIEVGAESLFEAIAIGLRDLRASGLAAVMPGPATPITVRVKAGAAAEHTVLFRQFETWLSGTARSPQERLTKDRLRAIAEGDAT